MNKILLLNSRVMMLILYKVIHMKRFFGDTILSKQPKIYVVLLAGKCALCKGGIHGEEIRYG